MLLVPGMVFTIEPMVNEGKEDFFVDEENEWTVYTEDGVVITAEYNTNGTLKNIKSIVDVKSGDEVIEPTADNEKVFAWDSLDGMKPLAVETK